MKSQRLLAALAASIYRAPGRGLDTTDLRNMRAEIREAYLAGWRDGVADAHRARYGFGPDANGCELTAADEAKLAKAAAAREPYGSMTASEVAARCRRRLWDEARNHDPAIDGETRAAELDRALGDDDDRIGTRIVLHSTF